jgi:hypothetical protein
LIPRRSMQSTLTPTCIMEVPMPDDPFYFLDYKHNDISASAAAMDLLKAWLSRGVKVTLTGVCCSNDVAFLL